MVSVRLEVLAGLSYIFAGKESEPVTFDEEAEEGSTVGDVIRKLADKYQAFSDVIFDGRTNMLSGRVTVVLNDRLLEALNGLDTRIRDGDVIRLFPIVAGG